MTAQSPDFRPVCGVLALALFLTLHGCISTHAHSDARSHGERLDDNIIARGVKTQIYRSLGQLREERVRVSVYKGIVLLTGQLSTLERRQLAGTAADRVRAVRMVQNEIVTQPVRTVLGRTSDSLLSMLARSKLAESPHVPSDRIKLVVDRGTIYMLGIVRRSEGSEAAEAVRYLRGVEKVVMVFEYLD